MPKKEIIGAHLREDIRIHGNCVAQRKIHRDAEYEIELCVYPGIPTDSAYKQELVTGVIRYKEEDLVVTVKLLSIDVGGNPEAGIDQALAKLLAGGKGPFHLIRDAKQWCRIPFTQRDRANILKAGLDIHS